MAQSSQNSFDRLLLFSGKSWLASPPQRQHHNLHWNDTKQEIRDPSCKHGEIEQRDEAERDGAHKQRRNYSEKGLFHGARHYHRSWRDVNAVRARLARALHV